MFNKDKFKETLNIEEIQKVLTYYGANHYINSKGEIVSETICHNKSGGSHKLYYYPDTHTFYCYTHCGAFDIYDLIIKVNKVRGSKIDFHQAIKILGEILGRKIDFSRKAKGVQLEVKLIDDWAWLNRLKPKSQIIPDLDVINKSIMKYFDEMYPSAWVEEGISLETMEKYGIRFYPEMNQTIIPHLDGEGNLIGIRSRNWRKDLVKKAKYIPTFIGNRGFNHPLGYSLYGLFQNKEAIKKKKKVMIVEGEKSCLFSDTFYGDNNFVVAICGSNMSKYQANLLLDLQVEEVIIAMDKEYMIVDSPDYDEYMKKIRKIAKLFAPYCTTYHLTDTKNRLWLKESPLDLNKEELELMMKEDKLLITLKDLEETQT
ncbi:hypothetical protein P3U36_08060 [Staphylococcus pseudintermedius]|uniref:hypothetical protein n=1 Tax=Staphylococcus pseudintermedius TaxID=283734 RepID=UPI002AC94B8C|nr:hypothetical protein [Staphylococcus pseudintermedius]WQL64633.1 hypothetical protein P3U36_08060 [Staphylococcus pseudintermedius]